MPEVFQDYFQQQQTTHRYRVIRLWELEPQLFFELPSLLPLAVLAKTQAPEQLLQQVSQQLDRIEDRTEQLNLKAATQILAGIKFTDAMIEQFFQEELMQESVIYQKIFNRGIAQGVEQGLQQGLQQGIEEGEFTLLTKLLSRRLGLLDAAVLKRLRQLSRLQLEALGEALLDMQSRADLDQWLATYGNEP
ncbi:DUF4351 domain-containing protein [Synechococcus sp. BDU 130192]|uniref:DUF4351 domain-containing protein n=1 Tax=Synechococcus sp. BDU 130192 TaxID=2042059 RepID=UPI0020B12690|nr:DUF4351 domain-containing protein [Synechococcus sp. BDU 130192]